MTKTETQTTKPCECSLWTTAEGAKLTDCTKQTSSSKKMFLPGHDAKLKGALIRAKHSGTEVSDGRGISGPAASLASRFGFGAMVANATPRSKKVADTPCAEDAGLAKIISAEEIAHEAAQVAQDEAEAVAKVRAARPRRTRKVAVAAK